MHQNTVIGLDVGRSAVKAVAFANGLYHRLTFPSLVSPAIEIADENSSLIAERETVEIAGKRFFTGDTARLQGGAGSSVGLSDDWIDTPEYQALIASALKRLAGMNVRGLDNPYIVLGTPAHIYGTQRQRLVERTQEVIMTEMKVLPQPMGAFLSFFYDAKGTPILANARDETGRPRSWAVVDVGHYTTDFLLMREGNYIERCAGSCEGTNNAVEYLNRQLIAKNIHTTLIDCEAALRTKSVRHFGTKDVSTEVGEAVESVVSKIMGKANSLLSSEVSSLDGVLLAGGGAPIIYEALNSRWPNTVLLDNARMAVADGFCRYGMGAMKKRQAERKAA